MSTKKSRREFLITSLKASLAVPLLSSGLYACNSATKTKTDATESKSKKLNILILGGTSFLGPHQIAYALDRGHSVSIFTRGKTIPKVRTEVFDKVEHLIGDRNDNLKALENRKWDAVIDNSGRQVDWTRKTAELLKDNCELYMYTSSVGVYYPYVKERYTESDSVVLKVPEDATEIERYEYDYGVMKANSELVAAEHFGNDRTIVVRPTYMIGPGDRTDRFMHWPIRLSQPGEVLVPGKSNDAVQYIDIRDAAEFMIRLLEDKKSGIYNATGPKQSQNILDFVKEANTAFNIDHNYVSIDDYEFLEKNEIYFSIPWIMPTPDHLGSAGMSTEKVINNGMTYRFLKQTVKDTHDWWNSDAVDAKRRDDYMANADTLLNKEAKLLDAWKKR
ncbi:NAD-dependent epimerase/dehydratase family protein [Ichthyenterobacterium sp. W332]|uniref:NAD-dependent epimerase/dehydratase family protein n=1 Tax=Microcosmobacter mediterraneus TaxID=3075607 RepID=A0ABU2YN67_9FLAO|nr:NAD-dependent epimerase/dehydratase family protein [Ichthyenterobacterium sp. W332]MDT0558715.1 NAD-dependent epimerase/dehydratase family protein [Ichthyenterobacterium sp. W332]